MMHLFAWLGPLLLFAAVAGALARLFGAPRGIIFAAMIAAAAVAAFAPAGKTTPAEYVYSITGPLSSASLVLLAAYLTHLLWPGKRWLGFTGAPLLAAMVLVIALPLYVFELCGRGPDLYRLGYAGWVLPAALAALLLIGLWRRAPIVAVWVLLAGALYLAEAYGTVNLFDYLVDPVAVLLALAVVWRWTKARIRAEAELMSAAR